MNKFKLLSVISATPLVALPFVTSCGCSKYSPDTNFTPVHEFINDRIFSVSEIHITSTYIEGTYGTMWLFYHVTDSENAKSDYTYYALTNNHVTSGFNSLVQEPGTYGIFFGYQDKDSASSTNKTISNSSYGFSGKANCYSCFGSQAVPIESNEYFKPLFTTYIKSTSASYGYDYYDHYRDMTIVKVDFDGYQNKDVVKNRLKKLNEYADAHNNMLVEFDDYSDITSPTQKVDIYTGGFPLANMYSTKNDPNYIFKDHSTKFQSMKFENCEPNYCDNISDLISDANDSANDEIKSSSITDIYDSNNEYDPYGFLYSPDWVGPKVTEKNTPFGGGASGSMAVRCSDVNDPDTYKVTGIYWGGMEQKAPSWGFTPHFSPFTLNFGKNLGDPIAPLNTWSVLEAFKKSDAYSKNTPTNYLMYSN